MVDAMPQSLGQTPLQSALATLSDAQKYELARILQQFSNPDDAVQVVGPIPLDTAKDEADPFEIGSFQCLWSPDATDTGVSIDLRINSKLKSAGKIPFKKNSTFNQSYPVARAYLSWAAQSGKTITLILFRHASFTPGVATTQISGGVTLSEGGTRASSVVSLTTLTAVALLAASSTRLKALAFNDTGNDLYIGSSSSVDDGTAAAGANKGVLWAAGTPLEDYNTGALYCYNPGPTAKVALCTYTS